MHASELRWDQLYHGCDPNQFGFETTADLPDLTAFIGQPRVVEALRFGAGIEREGYNIFALGQPGTGRSYLVRHFFEERAAGEEAPPDYCYVNNFEDPKKPRTLRLPPGKGRVLSQDMEHLMEEVRNTLKAAFENEENQNRLQSIKQEVQEKQSKAFEELEKKAEEKGIKILRTPSGLVFAPVRDGEVAPPEEFNKLPEEERNKVGETVEELQQEAQKIFQKIPAWERDVRDKVRELREEITAIAVGPLIEELRKNYEGISTVRDYLDAVEKDILKNVPAILSQDGELPPGAGPGSQLGSPALRSYQVNVLMDHGESKGAPVIYEDNPTHHNLIGRVEHLAHMGTLLTDFNMLRAGALHRANGGYLVLDAIRVLMQPFAWEGLKRALKSREVRIESLGEAYGLISTVSLEPAPVPLDVKVTLIGPPLVYYLLRHHDPEFAELFKVSADFDFQMGRTPETQNDYAKLVATVARKEGLRSFNRAAVARVIEHGARMAGDGEKLSIEMQRVTDLLREADYWAGQNGNGTVDTSDVQRAIDAWTYRSDRIRQRMQEEIQRGTILIDTADEKIGQINGLSVIQLGEFAFGRPSRITVRVQMGKGRVVDIEREVEMGGPIHSKGVLILTGFLGERYATDQPLSLSASLVFEQSYSGIEGDSASSAELYGLLSAIAGVPVKQSIAVTGSVNQHGQIQPVGGINEKIEGFFDTCKTRGLTGEHAVLIPAANVKHLMLRQDVVEAVKGGQFHIYAIEYIDEGLEILTGMPAGEKDEDGNYPKESVNGKVRKRLVELAERWQKFSRAPETGKEEA
jgi:lon-related putative ATP-dependent protease